MYQPPGGSSHLPGEEGRSTAASDTFQPPSHDDDTVDHQETSACALGTHEAPGSSAEGPSQGCLQLASAAPSAATLAAAACHPTQLEPVGKDGQCHVLNWSSSLQLAPSLGTSGSSQTAWQDPSMCATSSLPAPGPSSRLRFPGEPHSSANAGAAMAGAAAGVAAAAQRSSYGRRPRGLHLARPPPSAGQQQQTQEQQQQQQGEDDRQHAAEPDQLAACQPGADQQALAAREQARGAAGLAPVAPQCPQAAVGMPAAGVDLAAAVANLLAALQARAAGQWGGSSAGSQPQAQTAASSEQPTPASVAAAAAASLPGTPLAAPQPPRPQSAVPRAILQPAPQLPGPLDCQPTATSSAAAAGSAAAGTLTGTNGTEATAAGTADMLRLLRGLIPGEVLQRYSRRQAVDPWEQQEAERRLQAYRSQLAAVAAAVGQDHTHPPSDERALSLLREAHPAWPCWRHRHGHPPGIELGRLFSGRCELAAAGVHAECGRGVSSGPDGPACAVCLSGGPESAADHGDWLVYSVGGGTREALALQEAFLQQRPLRVVRGNSQCGVQYSYDGLFCIVKEEPAAASATPASRFHLVGIPGHYNAAARRITPLQLRGFRAVAVQLAPRSGAAGTAGAAGAAGGQDQALAPRQQRHLAAPLAGAKRVADGRLKGPRGRGAAVPQPPHLRPGFLLADISGGKEDVKIPVFNEFDAEPPPTNFTYIRSSFISSPAARELHAAAAALMPGGGQWCGLEQGEGRGVSYYRSDGILASTEPLGVWECCSGCRGRRCRLNRVATAGVRLPLEVFRVPAKGWGVRCSVSIPAGSFVCSYEGEIITSAEGEHRHNDVYFFDLDFALLAHAHPTTSRAERRRLPPLPRGTDTNPDHGQHLLLDALSYGSVGRFVNHSCRPNLAVQAVLTEGSSCFKYTVGLFALRDIPAQEELCYDYSGSYARGGLEGKELHCQCGAPGCRGKLL